MQLYGLESEHVRQVLSQRIHSLIGFVLLKVLEGHVDRQEKEKK
jgi:hypothetical protein